MKTLNYIIAVLFLAGSFFACSDWDDHYSQQESVVNSNNVEIIDMPVIDYLQSISSYSSMSNLFKDAGLYDRITTENLLYTIFVIPNELATDLPAVSKADEEEKDDEATFLAKAHISTVSLSPSNMRDNQRLLMWNGKYTNIAKMEAGADHAEVITINGSRVKKVIKLTNGFVYELESLINTPKSLLEVLEDLSDDYSMFKEMVLSKNVKTFDKEASVPNGVDASGNTTYDSIHVTINPYFLHKGVDLSSENSTFTMLIPSNELITNAIADAKSRLASWGMSYRPDSVPENWCFQVAFFDKIYTREDFQNNTDLGVQSTTSYEWSTNVFGKQWRTTVNEVDLDNPIEMSNGIAYYMTKLKIPQNILIWRLKEVFHSYDNLSDRDREIYYRIEDFTYNGWRDENASWAWTPGGDWPIVYFRYIWFYCNDSSGGALEFTPYRYDLHDDNSYDIETYLLPPGEYNFHFGCGKINQTTYNVEVSFYNDFTDEWVLIRDVPISEIGSFNYDRTGGGYPEFFFGSEYYNSTYSQDGRLVGTFTVTGDKAAPIRFRYRTHDHGSYNNFFLHHWCIRPTANCY